MSAHAHPATTQRELRELLEARGISRHLFHVQVARGQARIMRISGLAPESDIAGPIAGVRARIESVPLGCVADGLMNPVYAEQWVDEVNGELRRIGVRSRAQAHELLGIALVGVFTDGEPAEWFTIDLSGQRLTQMLRSVAENTNQAGLASCAAVYQLAYTEGYETARELDD